MGLGVKRIVAAAMAVSCWTAVAAPARADIFSADLIKGVGYQQTGPNSVAPANGGANAELVAALFSFSFSTFKNNFDSASMTYPGPGSPQSLPLLSPEQFLFVSNIVPESALDAAYPNGAYTVTGTNSVTSATQSETFNYVNDYAFGATPAFDPSTYSALGAWSIGKAFTLHFNAFTPDPTAPTAEQVIELFGPGGIFFSLPLAPSATSYTVPASTFSKGGLYTIYHLFDQGPGAIVNPNDGAQLISLDELTTSATFTMRSTAVPEPGAWVLMILGLCAVGAGLRRRARAGAST